MIYFTLKQLEAFEAVAQCGNFTKASEKLYTTQSSISEHMRILEEWYGAQLIIRYSSNRKLELTEPGRLLFYHTKKS